jgi:hypothetical protein
VFFVVIAIYLTFRFEWRMALAALIAVIHDIIITVGVYAVTQFEVVPATVVAFLTILGYSLYDTVVVFDKVRDNQARLGTERGDTYSAMVNRSLNQVLMRSINTSLLRSLPVASLLHRDVRARRPRAQGLRACPVRRPHRRRILVDLRRHSDARVAQGSEPRYRAPGSAMPPTCEAARCSKHRRRPEPRPTRTGALSRPRSTRASPSRRRRGATWLHRAPSSAPPASTTTPSAANRRCVESPSAPAAPQEAAIARFAACAGAAFSASG